MQTKNFIAIGALFIAAMACNSAENKDAATTDTMMTTADTASTPATVAAPDNDALIKEIEAEREKIEANVKTLARTTISTKGLKEKIKQKWSKFDFYKDGDQLVRIKSYPYPQISTRTEEFYFRNGVLILVFVNDNGLTDKKEGEKSVGKTYYFQNGVFLTGTNKTGEKDTDNMKQDAANLLRESDEYKEILATNMDATKK